MYVGFPAKTPTEIRGIKPSACCGDERQLCYVFLHLLLMLLLIESNDFSNREHLCCLLPSTVRQPSYPAHNAAHSPALHFWELFYECPKTILFGSISSHHYLQSAHRPMFRGWALMVCLKESEEKAVPITLSSCKIKPCMFYALVKLPVLHVSITKPTGENECHLHPTHLGVALTDDKSSTV